MKKYEKKQELKKQIREKFRTIRKNIPIDEKKKFSKKITNVLSRIFVQHSSNIFSQYIALFAGTEEEPNIVALIKFFPDQKFCFPKISEDKKTMDFFSIEKLEDLERGEFGIQEPKDNCKKVSHSEIKIFCIPAVSIDTKGFRLGMGGGYYDKYLSQFSKISEKEKKIIKIGIIFSCQISTNIFDDIQEKFDIPVDIIASEKEGKSTPNYRVFS